MNLYRVDESRSQLLNAFYYALGGYAAHEEWQRDPWRDLDIGRLIVEFQDKFTYILPHLKHLHEIVVSRKSHPELASTGKPAWEDDPAWHLLKHCSHLVIISTILTTKVMEKIKLLTSVQSK